MSEATEVNNQVVITRIFDAPVERVWQAWTDPELMAKWWGPKDFTAPTIKMDFQEGGKYLYCMHGVAAPGTPASDFWSTGIYTEIVPLKKIAYTDSFADEQGNAVPASTYGMPDFPDELQVTIEFESLEDGKTKMTLTHVGAPTDSENAKNMELGWNQSFDKLAEAIK